jgi:methionyl-tRNA synthetase
MTAPHTYITTTIPYVNARPHIGFALELVQADLLARYRRGRGDAVRFQAGTDDNSGLGGRSVATATRLHTTDPEQEQ